MKLKLALALFAVVILALPITAYVNQMNVQGRLSSSGTYSDGDYNMHFALYNVSTGGTAIWNEIHQGANEVGVSNGYFSTTLGEITALTDFNFLDQYWLGVNIENDGEMAPRSRLTPLPGCYTSKTAEDVNCTSCISDSDADNDLTISTDKQVVLLGGANFNDMNVSNTIVTGNASTPTAGDINLSGNLILQSGTEIVMPDPGTQGAFSLFVDAASNVTEFTTYRGDNVYQFGVSRTAGGILQVGLPMHVVEFGATPVIDRITVYDYNVGATFYVDDANIVSVDPNTQAVTVEANYTTNQTSGTEFEMNSSNTTGLPYKMNNKPHLFMITITISDLDAHEVYFYGYEVHYHLEYTGR
ncbi:hypothetical protein KJ891_05285 [Candidatus Micrarchaeota archaeon]|nr:hypothetical protein [Candidatus Micrarchaeota archaeon]